jgi:hypothetical protein
MDIPAPSERLVIKPKPKPEFRRLHRPGVKAHVLGRIGDLFVIEIPITSFENPTQTFKLVGATIHDGCLAIEDLGGRWRSYYMAKGRVENENWFEFRYASPLTAINLNNLLAAAKAIEK